MNVPSQPCGPACACAANRPDPAVPLAKLGVGAVGTICEARLGADDAALLRAMGLSLSAKVRLCRAGEPCIVAVLSSSIPCQNGAAGDGRVMPCCSSRIGLARSLAERIWVNPAPAAGA